MSTRSILNNAGGTLDVFPETGDISRIELTVESGWVRLPLAADCDLFELDTVLAAGGKRVLFTHSGVNPDIVEGQAPTAPEIAKSAFRWPMVWPRGSERKKGVELYVALDPTDDTPQAAAAILVLSQAAKV